MLIQQVLNDTNSVFVKCPVYGYWTLAQQTDKEWIGVLEGIKDALPWFSAKKENIGHNFCKAVHNYIQTCEDLRRHPEAPKPSPDFDPDAPVVCEITGGGTRLYIDDTQEANLIINIVNSVTGTTVESYQTKELITEALLEDGKKDLITSLRFVDAYDPE